MGEHELIGLRRLGERLISAFARLIDYLPADARGISGMSRFLDVHKATCQRIVEGSRCDDGLAAFVRFPGAKAMELVTKACRDHGVDQTIVNACEAAVHQLEQELQTRGVSLNGLVDIIAAIHADQASQDGHDGLEQRRGLNQRRALFGAARRLTGESVEAKVAVSMFTPAPSAPGHLHVQAVSGLIGVHRESFARPIISFAVAGWWEAASASRSRDPAPAQRSGLTGSGIRATSMKSAAPRPPGERRPPTELVVPEGAEPAGYHVLAEFSTAGVKAVRIGERDARTLLVVDVDQQTTPNQATPNQATPNQATPNQATPNQAMANQAGRPRLGQADTIDVTVLFETDAPLDPAAHPMSRLSPAARIVQPTQTLVLDVYVHRSLVGPADPRVGCFSLSAPPGDTVEGGYDQCWYERFPETLAVEAIRARANPRGGRSGRALRLAERLGDHLFKRTNAKLADFKAYRLHVSYPVWQSEYRVQFEPIGLQPSDAK